MLNKHRLISASGWREGFHQMRVQYDIGKVFEDSFALIRAQPWWVLAWGALLVVVPVMPMIPMLGWMFANMETVTADPEAIEQMIGLNILANLSSVLQFVLLIPILAAVARTVLGKAAGKTFIGLRASMDELWVFVVYMAMMFGFFIVAMIAFLIALFVGLVSGYASGNEAVGVGVGIFVGFLTLLPLIWVLVRLSLLIPASVDLNTFALIPAWKASKGHFWPLLGTAFLVILVALAVSIVWMILFLLVVFVLALIGGVTGMITMDGDPALWNWVPLALIAAVLLAVPTFFMQGINTVLGVAPFASAWRQLKPSVEQQAAPVATPEL